jgi:hypothetical protein
MLALCVSLKIDLKILIHMNLIQITMNSNNLEKITLFKKIEKTYEVSLTT